MGMIEDPAQVRGRHDEKVRRASTKGSQIRIRNQVRCQAVVDSGLATAQQSLRSRSPGRYMAPCRPCAVAADNPLLSKPQRGPDQRGAGGSALGITRLY